MTKQEFNRQMRESAALEKAGFIQAAKAKRNAAELEYYSDCADLAAPKIKPLVWDVRRIPERLAGGFWATAVSAFGSYEVHIFNPISTAYLQTPSYDRMQAFETVEAAKAAAQTDYERRIMECLE